MGHRRPLGVMGSLLLVAALVTGCDDDVAADRPHVGGDVEAAGEPSPPDDPDGPAGDERDTGEPGGPARDLEARIDDGAITLLHPDGDTEVPYTPSEEEGEAVHVAVRPGDHERGVVLALFRVDHPELGAHYELRYLVVEDGQLSDLYWFPWRLQVDARVAEVLDVPTVPAWAPDGSALAWIEWDEEGTSLRLVGWHDDATSSNPSDAVATYRLTDVPAGTQLDSWEPGSPALFTAHTVDGEPVEIELAVGELALSRGRA